ncbi:uncharacterized protein LOC134831283 [Culicoides brevitarsis]|uniref:uncharacterized protein LOC134831283 n=1 Tax=Culicoides brevitarsis TaxID=469753 RepID=UPI00307B3A2D
MSVAAMLTLLDLNDDCLLHILKFFSLLELIKIRGTSNRLDNLLRQCRHKYANLNFMDSHQEYYYGSPNTFHDVLRFLGPTIKSIKISSRNNSRDISWIEQFCVNLETLEFNYLNFENDTEFDKFTAIISNLRSLTIYSNKKKNFNNYFGNQVVNAPKLEELRITCDFNWCNMGKFFKNIKSLKSFSFHIRAKMKPKFCLEFLKHNLQLMNLEISYFSVENGPDLVNFIANELKGIESLKFYAGDVTNLELLADLPNLKKLSVLKKHDSNFDPSSAVNNLLEKLIEKNNLQKLEISQISIDNDLIAKLTNLKSLSLEI